MDRFTYEQLRRNRAELRLPQWWYLRRTDRHKVKRMTPDQIISTRTVLMLLNPQRQDRFAPKRKPGEKNDVPF